MPEKTLYCGACKLLLEGGQQETDSPPVCPKCGGQLVEVASALRAESSEELEQEMLFLGHEGLFDDFF